MKQKYEKMGKYEILSETSEHDYYSCTLKAGSEAIFREMDRILSRIGNFMSNEYNRIVSAEVLGLSVELRERYNYKEIGVNIESTNHKLRAKVVDKLKKSLVPKPHERQDPKDAEIQLKYVENKLLKNKVVGPHSWNMPTSAIREALKERKKLKSQILNAEEIYLEIEKYISPINIPDVKSALDSLILNKEEAYEKSIEDLL